MQALLLNQVRVVEEKLEDVLGVYDIESHTIYVDYRLSPQDKRATVMHETIHAERGDYAIMDNPHADVKQERAVERETAIRLIGFSDLAEGMLWCRGERELADYLGVNVSLLLKRFDGLPEIERMFLRELCRNTYF